MSKRNYLFDPAYWWLGLSDWRKALQNLRVVLFHRDIYRIARSVDGHISAYLGFLLASTARRQGARLARPVVEVGAFKGLSTVYLSVACAEAGVLMHSFELFQGLPEVDRVRDDPKFTTGQFLSTRDEYERNVREYGRREAVDLHVGDARDTLESVLGKSGFSLCFLDVDLYEPTHDLLAILWRLARGGETILVHDMPSKGVRLAIDEFHRMTGRVVQETSPEPMTAMLQFPLDLGRGGFPLDLGRGG